MKFIPAPLEGLLIIDPVTFTDSRGEFFESFSEKEFEKACPGTRFVQDNQSVSSKGVLRGLHFQRPPHAQGKLVRVVRGSVVDAVVDIRAGSATFGKHFALELSAANRRMLWIPEGFAHGFEVLEDQTVFLYKCTAYYNRESEGGIRFDDPSAGIPWQTKHPVVSDKDLALPFIDQIKFRD